MFLKNFSNTLKKSIQQFRLTLPQEEIMNSYKPTFYLQSHYFQCLYDLYLPQHSMPFRREKVYFTDGGHLCLDWVQSSKNLSQKSPIILIMHGVTGGSQFNYIRALANLGIQHQYRVVCLNSRGINCVMTSPIPFTAYDFHQVESALIRVRAHYQDAPIYIIGCSFGGNYILRYLLNNPNLDYIKGFVGLSFPFSVRYVMDNMNMVYQKYLIQSYIQRAVFSHQMMNFWFEIGLVDQKQLKQSKTLKQFHQRITTKITGIDDVNEVFARYQILGKDLQRLNYQTMIMTAKDDPIVGFQSFPIEQIVNNSRIKLLVTEKGGHLTWFEGLIPRRWYPKPVFSFLNSLRQ